MEESRLSGMVVRGLQNGRQFGFPTINVRLNADCHWDEVGVFAAKVTLRGQSYNGMMYVGTRPTLNLTEKTIEINLFDFDGDCYDEQVDVCVGQKIRGEQKFASIDDLIFQLKKDKNEILQLLYK
ncbi:MAG: riboflavin kinase [Bacteroidales bacterium]|nr:riboflavin kinase [Bacteroidales bacterium]